MPGNCTYKKKSMTEINKPKGGHQQRQDLFVDLYLKAFPAFARFVCRMGGSLDEAKDVFQDAVITWYEKSVSGNFKVSTSEKAYILGTARYLWIRRFKNTINETELSNSLALYEDEELNASISTAKVLRFLEKAGQKCMELLKAFYYDKESPEDLARHFGFSGERSSTVQKYKCLEKVRKEVKQRSLNYADFID